MSRAALTLLSPVVAALGAGVPAASAATTTIGAVNEIAAGADPADITSGGFVVQVGEAAGTYAVPPGYGVITAWSHSTGTAPGNLTFKVYRPTGAPKEFRAVAADPRAVAPDTNHVFPVQIPVRAGDRIGLSSEGVQLAFETGDPADRVGFFSPDPPPEATDTTDGNPFESYKLDVAATVESDLNRDGVGDDSQGLQGTAGAPGGGDLVNCASTVRVGRGGIVNLCDATNPPTASTAQTLAGKLPSRLATAARRKRARPKVRTLGTGHTKVPPGQTVPVSVKLGVKAMKALTRKGSLKVKASIESRGVDGKTATVKHTVTLKPQRRSTRKS